MSLIAHSPLRVLIVDDDGNLRDLLALAVGFQPGLEVVADAATGRAAIEIAGVTEPDIVILDLGLPDLVGTDVLAALREACPSASIVVFSGSPEQAVADEVVTAGAAAYVTKGDIDVLLDVLQRFAPGVHDMVELVLDASAESARRARRFALENCERWGCSAVVETALLIVSELVTNAIVHGRSTVHLRLIRDETILRIEVRDGAGGTPEPQAPLTDDQNGRGLMIVGALSQAWGIEPDDPGKVVWAELALS